MSEGQTYIYDNKTGKLYQTLLPAGSYTTRRDTNGELYLQVEENQDECEACGATAVLYWSDYHGGAVCDSCSHEEE